MLVQFTHNPTEYIKGCLLSLNLVYKKQLKRQLILLAIGLVLITIGYTSLNDKDFFNDYLFAGGTFIALLSINYLYAVSKQKKAYRISLAQRSAHLENTSITFNFTDEALLYNDIEMSFNFPWHLIENYLVYQHFLMIKVKHNQQYAFIISKHMVGNEEKFNQIIHLLKTKIIL